MLKVYVDTSAYVKIFSDERGSEKIRNVFDLAYRGIIEPVISQWTIGESLAAVDKKRMRKEIKPDELDVIVATIMDKTISLVEEAKLIMVYTNQDIVSSSWPYITRGHLSADDALHVYSAEISKSKDFISADAYLLEAVHRLHFEHYNIESEIDYGALISKLHLLGLVPW